MNELLAAAALMAAGIGAPVPSEAPAVVVPRAVAVAAPRTSVKPFTVKGTSGWVNEQAHFTGSGFMHCSGGHNGSGWMNGSIHLNTTVYVRTADGTGSVPMSGFVSLSGSCNNGSGYVSGNASVSGYGTIYGANGRRAGTVRLSGTVFVNQYVSGQHLWLNEYASVSGRYDADPTSR